MNHATRTRLAIAAIPVTAYVVSDGADRGSSG